jgi:hypothetical protein
MAETIWRCACVSEEKVEEVRHGFRWMRTNPGNCEYRRRCTEIHTHTSHTVLVSAQRVGWPRVKTGQATATEHQYWHADFLQSILVFRGTMFHQWGNVHHHNLFVKRLWKSSELRAAGSDLDLECYVQLKDGKVLCPSSPKRPQITYDVSWLVTMCHLSSIIRFKA